MTLVASGILPRVFCLGYSASGHPGATARVWPISSEIGHAMLEHYGKFAS